MGILEERLHAPELLHYLVAQTLEALFDLREMDEMTDYEHKPFIELPSPTDPEFHDEYCYCPHCVPVERPKATDCGREYDHSWRQVVGAINTWEECGKCKATRNWQTKASKDDWSL